MSILGMFNIETIIKFVLKIAGISLEIWEQSKKEVVTVESSKFTGEQKFQWVQNAIITLFPKIGMGFAGFLAQAAWLVFERNGWPKGTITNPGGK